MFGPYWPSSSVSSTWCHQYHDVDMKSYSRLICGVEHILCGRSPEAGLRGASSHALCKLVAKGHSEIKKQVGIGVDACAAIGDVTIVVAASIAPMPSACTTPPEPSRMLVMSTHLHSPLSVYDLGAGLSSNTATK